MGQQSNKVIKRRRRKAYLARKKALAKAGVKRTTTSRSKAPATGDEAKAKKPAAKKPAAKKAAAKPKKEETAAVETTPEVATEEAAS